MRNIMKAVMGVKKNGSKPMTEYTKEVPSYYTYQIMPILHSFITYLNAHNHLFWAIFKVYFIFNLPVFMILK